MKRQNSSGKYMLSFIAIAFQSQAVVAQTENDRHFRCEEEKYKYFCECKILPNCGGQCWVPAFMKFELATGQETLIKYLDQQSGPSSEDKCNMKLMHLNVCR